MPIADEKFIAFTTYRTTGEAVSTPTWIVPVSDGRVGFWTAMGTGKTKRLKNDPRVSLQPSARMGEPLEGTTPVSGTAEMVQSGRLFEEVQGRVREKYGLMTKITGFLSKLGPQGRKGLTYADTVVLITLDDAAGPGTTGEPQAKSD